jgi:hypothetical protein
LRKFVGPFVYALLLLSFTVYIALDTFVIARVYAPEQASSTQSQTQSTGAESLSATDASTQDPEIQQGSGQVLITDNTYSDDHIHISITPYREYNSTIYVADVTLSSSKYLQTALAQNAYGRNVTEKTSEIAQENHAILAINGDYYGAQENGYVLRNGVLYRNTASRDQEDLVIDADGRFEIILENEVSAEALLENGAMQVLSFGPALVKESEICVSPDDEVGRARSSNPRTAIAMVDDLHYLFIVSDGRTTESAGLSLYELAQFAKDLGAKVAYNLDGGGSSTLYFNGEIINNPTTDGRHIRERSVSDIVFIGNG